MKHLLAVLLAIMPFTCIWAEDSIPADSLLFTDTLPELILDEMPNVTFYHDESITHLIVERQLGATSDTTQTSGYRVQIYSSNEPEGAMDGALKLEEELTIQVDVSVYVVADPPFWKVRLGDFATRAEADKYKLILQQQFPDLVGSIYVVSDHVILTKH
jgi:hypothetical protein